MRLTMTPVNVAVVFVKTYTLPYLKAKTNPIVS